MSRRYNHYHRRHKSPQQRMDDALAGIFKAAIILVRAIGTLRKNR